MWPIIHAVFKIVFFPTLTIDVRVSLCILIIRRALENRLKSLALARRALLTIDNATTKTRILYLQFNIPVFLFLTKSQDIEHIRTIGRPIFL